MEFGGGAAHIVVSKENNDLVLNSDVLRGLCAFAKGRLVQAPGELTLSVLKTFVEVFRRWLPTRR